MALASRHARPSHVWLFQVELVVSRIHEHKTHKMEVSIPSVRIFRTHLLHLHRQDCQHHRPAHHYCPRWKVWLSTSELFSLKLQSVILFWKVPVVDQIFVLWTGLFFYSFHVDINFLSYGGFLYECTTSKGLIFFLHKCNVKCGKYSDVCCSFELIKSVLQFDNNLFIIWSHSTFHSISVQKNIYFT